MTPSRSGSVQAHVSGLKARAIGVEAALEMLPTVVILLGVNGQIILMNRAARHMISENDGLLVMSNALLADRPSECAELQRLIMEAVSTSAGKGPIPAGSLFVTRKNNPALHVLVKPIRRLACAEAVSPCAAVFVTDPSIRVRPAEEVLRRLFNLTTAECRVTLLLADGKSPFEISQLLGVTANTVKTHLSKIYSKTSTSGQSSLTRLLTLIAIQLPANR
jgi:DNA-binding CsgD family transcriptional regulator